jgi:hypothetical protein
MVGFSLAYFIGFHFLSTSILNKLLSANDKGMRALYNDGRP